MPITFAKKPGLVIYLTAGDPDLATTREMAIAAIDNGADVIELGVPFKEGTERMAFKSTIEE